MTFKYWGTRKKIFHLYDISLFIFKNLVHETFILFSISFVEFYFF
jgi:hypothetical protein